MHNTKCSKSNVPLSPQVTQLIGNEIASLITLSVACIWNSLRTANNVESDVHFGKNNETHI